MSALELPNVQVAPHAQLLHTPEFFDPRKAYAKYEPDLEGAFLEGMAYRQKAGKAYRTAVQLERDGTSNALMLTDLQWDFMPWGRLPVTLANDVVLRAVVRGINGTIADYYTRVVLSLDGHVPFHISYGTTWISVKTGKPLDMRTLKAAVLNLVDRKRAVFQATAFSPIDGGPIDLGEIRSLIEADDTVAYWDHLQQTNQGPIWIFAHHCKIGTNGTNLHPFIAEMLSFMEGARLLAPTVVQKGHIRNTDWFGPLEPCRPTANHPNGGFQKEAFDQLVGITGRAEFFGVAEDFCDHRMKGQVITHLDDSDMFRRIAFATDGTAPIVPNAPHVLQQNAEARAKGVVFFTHDEPLVTA